MLRAKQISIGVFSSSRYFVSRETKRPRVNRARKRIDIETADLNHNWGRARCWGTRPKELKHTHEEREEQNYNNQNARERTINSARNRGRALQEQLIPFLSFAWKETSEVSIEPLESRRKRVSRASLSRVQKQFWVIYLTRFSPRVWIRARDSFDFPLSLPLSFRFSFYFCISAGIWPRTNQGDARISGALTALRNTSIIGRTWLMTLAAALSLRESKSKFVFPRKIPEFFIFFPRSRFYHRSGDSHREVSSHFANSRARECQYWIATTPGVERVDFARWSSFISVLTRVYFSYTSNFNDVTRDTSLKLIHRRAAWRITRARLHARYR